MLAKEQNVLGDHCFKVNLTEHVYGYQGERGEGGGNWDIEMTHD